MKNVVLSERAKNTGIRLTLKLIKLARKVADDQGFSILSGFVKKLLTDYVREHKDRKNVARN